MIEIQDGIVRKRFRKDRERLDRSLRERNDWPQ